MLSRSRKIENSRVIVLRSKTEVSELAGYLKGDVFIIGGASIYEEFADLIEKWIVTEIPETIEEADAFLPKDFLAGFEIIENIELEENLSVKSYQRKK